MCERCALASVPVASLFEDNHGIMNCSQSEDLKSNEQQLWTCQSLKDDKQYQCFKKCRLHFIHMNSYSLLPKMDELCLIVICTNAAVISITEVWLDGSVEDLEVEIPGYTIQRNDRQCIEGGVCIYVCSDIAFSPRPDLCWLNTKTTWVGILLPKTHPVLTG